jgi:23S rRNA (guanosine2251-2'-O)-methyltransferase
MRTKKETNRQHKSTSEQIGMWLCGKHPVFTMLQKKRRKIFEILVTQNSATELQNFLQKNSLGALQSITRLVDKQEIEAVIGKNQLHQGIATSCSPIPVKTQNDLLAELRNFGADESLPTLLLLDQISDPHNVGAIIRSAIGFGVKKIIFLEHNSPKENTTIAKSSAGAIESADLIMVTNFSNLMEKLKKIGYWCIGLASEGTASVQAIKEYKNIALVVGSEGSGIRELVKKNCDLLVKIEIEKNIESLNASVATAIALYEIARPISTLN